MSHLHSERLAALIDEPPNPAELAHLAACVSCTRERVAFQSVSELAKNEPLLGVPLTRWESLAPTLRAQGLIESRRPTRGRWFGNGHAWMQAAAALVVAFGGLAAGRYSAGAPVIPLRSASQGPADAATSADSGPRFQTVAEARNAQTRSQAEFQAAMVFLAQHDTAGVVAGSPESIRTRLAALDQVTATMDQALQQAPYDPIINGYYLTTIGQRAATLHQLKTASLRLTSY